MFQKFQTQNPDYADTLKDLTFLQLNHRLTFYEAPRFFHFITEFHNKDGETASQWQANEVDTEYIEDNQELYVAIQISRIELERIYRFKNNEVVPAEIYGAFAVDIEPHQKLGIFIQNTNIFLVKTDKGVSYHCSLVGELSEKDFFSALHNCEGLQSLLPQFETLSQKWQLEHATPQGENVVSKTYKI